MDILNSLNKIFIDYLAYIPGAVLKFLLWIMYIYFINITIFYYIIEKLDNYKIEIIILFMSLIYFIDIVFSFLSQPFKISRVWLKQEQISKIIKDNSELKKIYTLHDEHNKSFTSSLLDISNNIWYEVPMFFENKILLFKSLRSTLIVFSYINILFLLYSLFIFNLNNIFIWLLLLLIYLFIIHILKKEIEEYHIWYLSSILNINFYLDKIKK